MDMLNNGVVMKKRAALKGMVLKQFSLGWGIKIRELFVQSGVCVLD